MKQLSSLQQQVRNWYKKLPQKYKEFIFTVIAGCVIAILLIKYVLD